MIWISFIFVDKGTSTSIKLRYTLKTGIIHETNYEKAPQAQSNRYELPETDTVKNKFNFNFPQIQPFQFSQPFQFVQPFQSGQLQTFTLGSGFNLNFPQPFKYEQPQVDEVTSKFSMNQQTDFFFVEKSPLPTTESNRKKPSSDVFECGRVAHATSLIKKGKDYSNGNWPWLAAIFYKKDFICGGSISKTIFSVK